MSQYKHIFTFGQKVDPYEVLCCFKAAVSKSTAHLPSFTYESRTGIFTLGPAEDLARISHSFMFTLAVVFPCAPGYEIEIDKILED